MKNTTVLRVLLPLLWAVTFLSGCGTKDAITFNDNIVKSHDRLGAAVDAWGKAVDRGDLPGARRAQKTALETLAAINAESQTWKVPSGASAKNLLDSHHRLMKIEEEAIHQFGKIVDVLENPKLAQDQKGQLILAMSKDLDTREKAANAELLSLQQAFARDHNIKLLPPKK